MVSRSDLAKVEAVVRDVFKGDERQLRDQERTAGAYSVRMEERASFQSGRAVNVKRRYFREDQDISVEQPLWQFQDFDEERLIDYTISLDSDICSKIIRISFEGPSRYDLRGGQLLVTVEGSERAFVDATAMRISEIARSFDRNDDFYASHPIISRVGIIAMSLVTGYATVRSIFDLIQSLSDRHIKSVSITAGVYSLPVAVFVYQLLVSYIGDAYPNLEFDVGPASQNLHQRRRGAIKYVLAAFVIPILLAWFIPLISPIK